MSSFLRQNRPTNSDLWRKTIDLCTFLRVCFLASKIASTLCYLCSPIATWIASILCYLCKKNGFPIATWTTLFAKMAISRSGLMRTALPSSIGQKRRKNSPFLFYAPANLRNTIKLSTFLRVCFLASKIASALGYLCSKSMKTPRAPKPRTAQGQGASISVMNLIEK